jgi:phage terminase small subunit
MPITASLPPALEDVPGSNQNPVTMTRTSVPRAPAYLSPQTRKWWSRVLRDFDLDEHHVRLLTLAAEAWDRAQEAREAVALHGPVYEDRFGQPRARPEVAIERDSRIAFARLLRELDLDGEPGPDHRPPRLR